MMDNYFTSRMLCLSGGLMSLCGLMMALLGKLPLGGIYWAAAFCLFFAAWHFRLAGGKKEHEEERKNEQETV